MSRLAIHTDEPGVIISSEPLVLVSEQVDDYTNSFKYAEVLYEETFNQANLNMYLSECLILSENVSNYVKMQKLKALHEIDSNSMSIGDRSAMNTGWFDKIMNFIKKIWGKFVEKITRWVTTNNYYLEKYKDIILKKQPKIGEIQFDGSPCNFTAAVERIVSDVIIGLNPNNIGQLPAKNPNDANDKTAIKAMATIISNRIGQAYQPTADEEFRGWCAEYFEGKQPPSPKATLNPATDLNWTDMYNFCHDAGNIQNILKKDIDSIEKSVSAFIGEKKKALETYKNASPEDKASLIKDNNDLVATARQFNIKLAPEDLKNPDIANDLRAIQAQEQVFNKAPADQKQEANQKLTDMKNALAQKVRDMKIKNQQEKFQNNMQTIGAKPKEQNPANNTTTPKAKPANTKVTTNVAKNPKGAVTTGKKIIKASANIITALDGSYVVTEDGVSFSQAMKTNTTTANDKASQFNVNNIHNTTLTGKETNEEMDKKIADIQSKGEFFTSVSRDILAAKLTAVEFIYSQFMKIIRAHVESYVGQQPDVSSNKTQQAGNNYNTAANNVQTPDNPQATLANQTIDYRRLARQQ